MMSLLKAICSNHTMHALADPQAATFPPAPTLLAPGAWWGAEALGMKGDRDCKYIFLLLYF